MFEARDVEEKIVRDWMLVALKNEPKTPDHDSITDDVLRVLSANLLL